MAIHEQATVSVPYGWELEAAKEIVKHWPAASGDRIDAIGIAKIIQRHRNQAAQPVENNSRCKHCDDLDRQFAHLKSANTGAWQYRNEHGHWITCETQRPISGGASTGERNFDEIDESHAAARPSEPSAHVHNFDANGICLKGGCGPSAPSLCPICRGEPDRFLACKKCEPSAPKVEPHNHNYILRSVCSLCGDFFDGQPAALYPLRPTQATETESVPQSIICGNCGPTSFDITYDGTLGLVLKCVKCGEQKLIELPVAAAPSVAGTQPTPDEISAEDLIDRATKRISDSGGDVKLALLKSECELAGAELDKQTLYDLAEHNYNYATGAAQGTPEPIDQSNRGWPCPACHKKNNPDCKNEYHSQLLHEPQNVLYLDVEQAAIDIETAQCCGKFVNMNRLEKRIEIAAMLREAALAGPQNGQGWVKVEDRLPEEGMYVLAFEPHGGIFTGFCLNKTWCDTRGITRTLNQITHWKPLPAPPTGDAPTEKKL
jgi:hypothetical protein